MKIVITGNNACGQNQSGGIQNRVRQIYSRLMKKKDVEIEYFCPMTTKLDGCDVLHLYKLEPEYIALIKCAKRKGVKVVLSSVVPLTNGWKVDLKRILFKHMPIRSTSKIIFEIMALVDFIIVETEQERSFIRKHFKVPDKKIAIIPNGIDSFNFEGTQIFDKIGGRKDYVLQVGRIDKNKNVCNVIKALKGTGIDYVVCGGADFENSQYYENCLREASGDEHIHFLGWVDSDSDILKSAYANAKVLVLSSFQETFGLVGLEAAAAGCNLALTKWLPIADFKSLEKCWFFDANSVSDIRTKVVEAFYANHDVATQKKIMDEFSWDKIIEAHISVYNKLINHA